MCHICTIGFHFFRIFPVHRIGENFHYTIRITSYNVCYTKLLRLKSALSAKIISTHTNTLTYTEIWDVSKITDLDPADPTQTKVLLIYGYSDTDGNS